MFFITLEMSGKREAFHRLVEIFSSPVVRRGFSDSLEWEPPLPQRGRGAAGRIFECPSIAHADTR